MEENRNHPGKGGKVRWIFLGAALTLALIVVLGYLGLCIYAGRLDTVLPGVYAGDVYLGGMTLEQAEQAVEQRAQSEYADVSYTLIGGEHYVVIDGSLMENDGRAVAKQAYNVGRSEPFLKRGAVILAQLRGNQYRFSYEIEMTQAGLDAVEQALDQLSADVHVALVEHTWAVEGDVLTIKRGVNGVALDRDYARNAVLEAYPKKISQTLEIPLVKSETTPLNIQDIYDEIYVAPQDAYAVKDGDVVVMPHVAGVSFDVEKAQELFDVLVDGGMMALDLTRTEPELTQEELQRVLFADVLSQCTTEIGGTENRLNNVIVAAKAMDGVVLLPGEVFSYNNTLGPRTTARGYLPAPAYIGGKTVDDVGGGICQNSSTLYWAVLLANLEIVNRVNHMYTVGYVPDGLDATVAYNAIDFQFRNDTGFPVRIEARVEGRSMIILLHGTKQTENYVVMETERISTTPYKTIYRADNTVAVGKTVVETSAYTGRTVKVYRCVYDPAGKLLGRTLESTSKYRQRDKVILFNPADAERLGLPASEHGQETVIPAFAPQDVEASGAEQTTTQTAAQ